MRIEIEWAELHAPIFLAGTNLSQKLDPAKRQGLSMVYDEDKRHLYVTYNNGKGTKQTARVPETSVLSLIEAEKSPVVVGAGKQEQVSAAPVFNPNAAQVDSPTAHVFGGPGKGQTGRGPRVKG